MNETLDSTSEGTNEKIRNEEDQSVLLSENKSNKNQEKIKHIETNRRGVQEKQIIKKIKETRNLGKICKRKLINTREEVEMRKNGLLEMFNLPITDQNEIMNFKNNRRNLIETLERNHYKTGCNTLRRSIRKLNTTEIETQNRPISVRRSMMELSLIHISKQSLKGNNNSSDNI